MSSPQPVAAEYEHIEYKQSLSEEREIVETVAAFATAMGGTIFVGVRPDGSRAGVQLGRNSLENLANAIKRNTDPPQYPSIHIDGEEHSAVLSIQVPENPIKPVWAFGRPFKRVGRTNQGLSADETCRLMDLTRGRSWDALKCDGLRMGDIDRKSVTDFLRRSDQNLRTSTEGVLDNLGLMTREGFSYVAALLFAKNPQRYVPGAQIKCARFKGTTSVEFLDQQTLTGAVLQQAESAQAFIARNTRQGIRITGRPEREVIPEYPLEAIREALANAICHRDYAATDTIQVRIYEDRLEVWNPGMLPPSLTIEDLYREHASRPRNPRLAAALFRARLIEQWGTGTLRIIQACLDQGLPQPKFESRMGSFMVRFDRHEPALDNEALGAQGKDEREEFIIQFLHQNKTITRDAYQKLLGISLDKAGRDLRNLVRRGRIERRGQGRAAFYTLKLTEDDG